MIHLYLVRHGENRANVTKEFSSRLVDYSLNAKGIEQARQTATYFQPKEIHEIYTSPLKRARETAEIIAAGLELPVNVMENFREIQVGAMELEPTPENWAFHNRVFRGWLTGQPDLGFPDGENYHGLWGRMRTGVEQIVAGKQRGNFIIVGHGGIFTATLPSLCPGVDMPRLMLTPFNNCAVTQIRLDRRNGSLRGELISWASAAHLSGEAAEFVSGTPQSE